MFNFVWVFKGCSNKNGCNFGDASKFATLALLKIKVIWNGGYDVINRVHDVANKVLSRHSKYIVDVAIGPKFSGSSIFMTEANISSIL